MKKILLVLIVFVTSTVPLTLYSQFISGPTSLKMGIEVTYYANFSNMNGSINWSIGGGSVMLVRAIGNSVTVKTIGGGVSFLYADNYVNGIIKERATLGIAVTPDANSPNIEGLNPATSLSMNTNYIFKLRLQPGTTFSRWVFPPASFDLVSETEDEIVIKTKRTGRTWLTAVVLDSNNKESNNTISIDITNDPPPFSISSNSSFACNNEIVTYSLSSRIENLQNTIITWQSTSKMTLVSGQGTPTATYRASGNGYSTVKATVTYDGVTCATESQRVWVGAPETPRIEGLMIGDYEPGSYYRLMAISPYSDSYSWIANGAAQIVPDITVQPLSAGSLKATDKYFPPMEASSIMTLVTNYVSPPRIDHFTLSVKSWNRCGVSPEFSTNGTIVSRYNYLLKDGNEKSVESATLSPTSSPVTVKVYTFNTGTLVYSEKNVTSFNIQNTTLKDGIYVVVTTDGKGETKSEKVVKTRN